MQHAAVRCGSYLFCLKFTKFYTNSIEQSPSLQASSCSAGKESHGILRNRKVQCCVHTQPTSKVKDHSLSSWVNICTEYPLLPLFIRAAITSYTGSSTQYMKCKFRSATKFFLCQNRQNCHLPEHSSKQFWDMWTHTNTGISLLESFSDLKMKTLWW
jgi:hypothetical protein